jgi:hypothetical protein
MNNNILQFLKTNFEWVWSRNMFLKSLSCCYMYIQQFKYLKKKGGGGGGAQMGLFQNTMPSPLAFFLLEFFWVKKWNEILETWKWSDCGGF